MPETQTQGLSQLTDQQLIDWQDKYLKDPVFYCKDYLGVKYWWEGMDRLLNAIPRAIEERKPIVVGSGHALSKDFTISGCVPLWFLHVYAPSAIVAMTAPSDRQVKKVMWNELTDRYNSRPVKDEFGKLLICDLKVNEKCYALAFTTKETKGQTGKFQGFHADAVCVIVSEAQAVDDTIFDQIEGIETSAVTLTIFLGNPLRTSGRYAQMLRNKRDNIVINLSCLDSPNVIEKRTVIPGLCSAEWVEKRRQKWNADGSDKDPRWMGRVLGLVPTTSIDTVIGTDLYEKCIDKQLLPRFKTGSIGVDPAEFGDDDMVISVWESGKLLDEIVIPMCSPEEGSAKVMMAQKRHFPEGQIPIVVDCDGLGAKFAFMIRKMIPEELRCNIVEYYGSSTKQDEVDPQYANTRAECAFYAKEQMEAGLVSFNDEQYAKEEALAETYFINKKGKIQLCDKDDIKEQLGRSPDRWDARKLAIWGMKYAQKINPKDRWGEMFKRQNQDAPVNNSYMVA